MLSAEDFYTDLNRRVFEFVKKSYETGASSVDDINEVFTPEEVGRITKMKIGRMQLAENGISVLRESIASLRESMQKKVAEKVSTIDDLNKLLSFKRK